MKTERATAQTPQETDKEKWVKVQIYTRTHICTGLVYCPRQQRLLDMLNGLPGLLHVSNEFLPVSGAEIRYPDGTEETVVATVQSAHVNKANILFIREVEDGQTQGLGGQVGHKPYPYVPKPFTKAVKLCMPFYTMAGQMHCTERRRVADVLNSEQRFIALTNVEIWALAGKSESGVSFIAVNKEQILSLAELEPSPMEVVET